MLGKRRNVPNSPAERSTTAVKVVVLDVQMSRPVTHTLDRVAAKKTRLYCGRGMLDDRDKVNCEVDNFLGKVNLLCFAILVLFVVCHVASTRLPACTLKIPAKSAHENETEGMTSIALCAVHTYIVKIRRMHPSKIKHTRTYIKVMDQWSMRKVTDQCITLKQ
jgi:hypothetical protein